MINHRFEDNALHGIWVKWDSIKEQLLAEARGELANFDSVDSVIESTNGEVEGVKKPLAMTDRIKNVLFSMGISVKNGVASMKELVVQRSTADIARIKKMELVDSETGAIYCTWIKEGEWQKIKGECESVQVAVAETQLSQQTAEVIQQAADEAALQAAGLASQQAQNQITEQVSQEVQEQVNSEIKEQIEEAVKEQVEQAIENQLQGQNSGENSGGQSDPGSQNSENGNSENNNSGNENKDKEKEQHENQKNEEVQVEALPEPVVEEQPVAQEPAVQEPAPIEATIENVVQESAAALFDRAEKVATKIFAAMAVELKKSTAAFLGISGEITTVIGNYISSIFQAEKIMAADLLEIISNFQLSIINQFSKR
jgi:hypothetical protein